MKKTKIHVNQHVIKSNKKTGAREPVLTVKTYDSNSYGHQAVIYDNDHREVARVIYSPDKPLSCGATVWVEVDGKNGSVEVLQNEAARVERTRQGRTDAEGGTDCPSL